MLADERTLYPGATIGVIGDNQSSATLITTAKRMGFNVGIYGTDENSEAMQLADYKYLGALSDRESLKMFAERCDVVTYNSDKISPDTIKFISRFTMVPQRDTLLDIIQDRLIERSFFESLNINMAPYITIVNLEDVYQGMNSIGYPAILKPISRNLLNGKQLFINTATDIVNSTEMLDKGTYVLESYIEHQVDYAIVVTRDMVGNRQLFPTLELIYQDNQVVTAYTPADIDEMVDQELKRIANEIATNIDYVGTFEVTFFLSDNGSIYVNKVAPNLGSAGFVFEYAANVTEFEQHIRAIANLPLSEVMSNLPTVYQAIRGQDFDRVKTQWVLKNNWHFTFYNSTFNEAAGNRGHILIPTAAVTDTLKQIEATSVWPDIDFESKYNLEK